MHTAVKPGWVRSVSDECLGDVWSPAVRCASKIHWRSPPHVQTGIQTEERQVGEGRRLLLLHHKKQGKKPMANIPLPCWGHQQQLLPTAPLGFVNNLTLQALRIVPGAASSSTNPPHLVRECTSPLSISTKINLCCKSAHLLCSDNSYHNLIIFLLLVLCDQREVLAPFVINVFSIHSSCHNSSITNRLEVWTIRSWFSLSMHKNHKNPAVWTKNHLWEQMLFAILQFAD